MRRLFSTFLFTTLLATALLNATVIVPAEFGEVVAGSDLIAYGRVTDVRAEWVDGRQRIDTVVTVDVVSWLKGGTERTLAFTVPGGEIGRYRSVLIGAPVFRPGDEAFFFLKTGGTAAPYVFGLSQGVFRVKVDAQGQRQVTTPALLATSDAPEAVTRGAVSRRPVPLDAFRAQIRTVMAAARKPAQ